MRRLALAAVLILPCHLAAQGVPYNGCVDRAGVRITASVRGDVPGGAEATRENDKPVIHWNRGNLQWAEPVTQLFVYLHECGHHALGHLYKPNDRRWEQEADCWAMEMLVDGGMLAGDLQATLERDLKRGFRGDGLHLSGEATVKATAYCIAARTDDRLWRIALDSLVAAVPDTLTELVGQRMYDVPGERFESLLDLPGVFDCEIGDRRVFRCPIYSSPSERRAKGRFEDVEKIIRAWLPARWSAAEQTPGGYILRQLVAEDGMTGSRITLALTDHHIVFFLFQPYTE